jgi:glycosyltransferase involved in cell wall biosynthesis
VSASGERPVTGRLRVIHASREADGGGAARAAYRLHEALETIGHTSRMIVDRPGPQDPHVISPTGAFAHPVVVAKSKTERVIARLQRTANADYHSAGVLPGSAARRLSLVKAEVINLHWTAAGFLSVEQIGRLDGPVVWTLHDMWAFAGAEHVTNDGPDARWRSGYFRDNRPLEERGWDLNRWAWERKRAAWRRPYHLVAPTAWLARCAAESALLGPWPAKVIPNAVPVARFRPHPRDYARQALGLPQESDLILVGTLGENSGPSKGWDLLAEAVPTIARWLPEVELVVVGRERPHKSPWMGTRTHWLGRIADEGKLSLAYSAADVTVVPSRIDNLPQFATESQACGTPVVAFETCGLPDAVRHHETGYLARPFDTEELARGIAWILEDRERTRALGARARDRAVRLWAPAVVAEQYVAYYAEAIEARTRAGHED